MLHLFLQEARDLSSYLFHTFNLKLFLFYSHILSLFFVYSAKNMI